MFLCVCYFLLGISPFEVKYLCVCMGETRTANVILPSLVMKLLRITASIVCLCCVELCSDFQQIVWLLTARFSEGSGRDPPFFLDKDAVLFITKTRLHTHFIYTKPLNALITPNNRGVF